MSFDYVGLFMSAVVKKTYYYYVILRSKMST